MQTPTAAQLRTAIEVLNKLGERLNQRAADSTLQLPESPSSGYQAGRIQVTAIGQTGQIQSIAAQLEQWRNELVQQRRQCVSHHV